MTNSSFLSLIQNASLLLAMALVFDTTMRLWRTDQKIWKQVLSGVIVGLIGIALMSTPWIYGQGLIFDTRSILLSLSGVFFGGIPTLVAILITASYRFSQGGAYITGILVIIATGLMGILWRSLRLKRYQKNPLDDIHWWKLYLFGFLVHIVMLLLMLTQPIEIALPLLKSISLPILIIYPAGSLLLGLLMLNRLHRERLLEETLKSRGRLTSMVEILEYSEDREHSFIDFAMEEAIKLTESTIGFIFYYSEETKLFTLSSWSKGALELCNIASPQTVYELEKTGLWGEPVRQRRPIIINDFNVHNPLKKGYPEGHPTISRLLEVPIFSENKIVAVVGMGNKTADYEDIDAVQLSLLMEMIWKTNERKKAVEALRTSEENYRLLFNQSADGIFITTRKGELLDVNPSGCAMLGYNLEELKKDFSNIFIDTENNPLVEIIQSSTIKGQINLTERKYKTKTEEKIALEILTQVLPDGRVQKVVRNITERKRSEEAIQQAQKELRDLLEISDDYRKALLSVIEDQKEVEDALRKSEQSYRNLFDNITQGFAVHKIMLDKTGKPNDYQFVAANPAFEKLTGLKVNEIVGKNVRKILPGVEQKWIDIYGRVALTGNPIRFEDYTASIGKYYDVAAFCPESGFFAVVISDITERKKYEIEIQNFNLELETKVKERTVDLEIANHELESFSYSISHDLRAPLRSINGFSQIILEEFSEKFNPNLVRYFELIRKNASMMGNLVDDLLNFSRLGKQSLLKSRISPTLIVREIVDSLQSEFGNRKVNIVIHDLPDCEADPALIRQVFMNLVTNSVKFTKTKKIAQIEIGYLKDQKKDTGVVSCYYVKDNGVGFDMKFYDKLFGVFQRLHHSEDYEGTGVGLAIVERIVKKHGGMVWAEAAIEQGASFYFTLGESENG